MNQPTISLIIPAYNEEKYIGPCLDSILAHAGGMFHEILVVNNASTDGTKAEAEKRPGVRVIDEPNKGLVHARQCGYLHATGEILAYVDADTRMPEWWAKNVIDIFQKNPDIVSASGPYYYYDLPLFERVGTWLFQYVCMFPAYAFLGYMVVGGNFAIRRETIERMGGFDTSIQFYGEDTDIARRAHAFGKVYFSSRLLMSVSGRRITKLGFFKTGYVYTLNFFSEVFQGRPATEEYQDYR